MVFDKSEAFLEDKDIRIPAVELYESLKIIGNLIGLEIEIDDNSSLFY